MSTVTQRGEKIPPARGFVLTIEGEEFLDLRQLWPDGDAPQEPTVEHVCALIRRYGIDGIVGDWGLGSSLTVTVHDPATRATRVALG